MKRVMVNQTPEIGALLDRKAKAEHRSASSYFALLAERDLRATGYLVDANDHSVLLKKISEALTTDGSVADEFEKVLRKATRRRRTA